MSDTPRSEAIIIRNRLATRAPRIKQWKNGVKHANVCTNIRKYNTTNMYDTNTPILLERMYIYADTCVLCTKCGELYIRTRYTVTKTSA